jgi:hypothetical protein
MKFSPILYLEEKLTRMKLNNSAYYGFPGFDGWIADQGKYRLKCEIPSERGNPARDLGDTVDIEISPGNYLRSVIHYISYSWNGTLSSKLMAYAKTA